MKNVSVRFFKSSKDEVTSCSMGGSKRHSLLRQLLPLSHPEVLTGVLCR
jgi:hypothetical protein